MRRLLAAAALAAVGLLLASPTAAQAHALLAGSDPASGALLDKSPSVVVLAFTEAPDLSLSSVHVLDNAGRSVERGKPTLVPGQRNSVAVALPTLARGTYTVTWRTTSADDGHTTAGSFAFGVGVQPTAVGSTSGATDPLPSALSIIGRWTLYLGLALLLGAAAVALFVSSAAAGRNRRALIGSWLVAAAGAVALTIDAVRTTGVSASQLARTTTGTKLMVELIAVGVAGIAVALAARRPGARTFGALGVAAAAALLARANAGHAAASSIPSFTIATQWAHLVAIGVWIGGLPWFIAELRRTPTGERRQLARRFSTLAALALAAVLITGTARSIDDVGSWHGLFHTKFGVTLLIKLALVAVVLVLAALNRFRYATGAGRPLRTSATVEVSIAACVLVASAVLAGLTPSVSLAAANRAPTPLVAVGHDFGTTMRVRLAVSPGMVGPNYFVAAVTDYDTRRPISARAVSLRFAADGRPDIPASTVPLRRAGSTWVADSPVLAVDGRWRVVTVVERSSGGTEVPLSLQPRRPPTRITVQRTPGLPPFYTITSGSRQAQAYVDPGKTGANEVHFTYLDVTGQPIDADLVVVSAKDRAGRSRALTFRRLEAGHFVADAELTAGRWTFTATTADGFRASFSDNIRS
jgi:copper transport protein